MIQAAYHRMARALDALAGVGPDIDPRDLTNPSPAARWFDQTPSPFPAYPAPGAAAIDVVTLTVPRGFNGRIKQIAIVHVGGGFIDGSGNVIWRVKVNGAAVQGMQNLQSQLGTYAQPAETYIAVHENDLVEVTAEVPAGQPAMAGTPAARLVGWFFPIRTTKETAQ